MKPVRALLLISAALALLGGTAGCSAALDRQSRYDIWSDCGGKCVLRAGGFMNADVPDTFQVDMSLKSSQQVAVGVLTNEAYADFIGCFRARPATEPRRGYQCLTEATNLSGSQLWTGSDIRFEFDDAEGCAGYLMVVAADADAPVTIKPDERVKYAPAPQPTGVCTQNVPL